MRQPVIVATAVVTIIAVGLSVGFTQVARDSKTALDAQHATSSDAANVWQERVSQQLYAVVSTAFSLGGFAISTFTRIPPHNSTNVTDRMQFLSPDRFRIFCADLNANIPGLLSLQLQSSGVITQAYPAGSAPIGLDLLNHPTQNADVYRAIEARGTVVAGPLTLIQGGQGIIVRYPIFAVEAVSNKTLATWWGNAAIVMRVAEFLRDIGVAGDMAARGQHWALWFADGATGARVVMGNSTGADVAAIAAEGEVRRVSLPNGNYWSLGTAPLGGFDGSASPAGVALTVVVTLAVAAAVAGLLCGGFVWYGRITRSTKNAPTGPPLYLLFTDIESSTQLWAAAPDEMPDVMAVHGDLIRDAIAEFGGYEVKTIGDSFMIATETCEAALGIATGVQTRLVGHTWPATVAHFYGCEYLRVRIGVHRCTDVTAAFDEVSKGYDYHGNDVNYAARVESMALGAEVMVSRQVEREVFASSALAGRFPLTEMGTAELKGIEGAQPLYRLTVPGLAARRDKIDEATLAAASECSIDIVSASLAASDAASSARSTLYGADDSHALAELVFAAVGHNAVSTDPEAAEATLATCAAHHEAFTALLAPFKGPDRAALMKQLTGKFGLIADSISVARLAVRVGLISHHRAAVLCDSGNRRKFSTSGASQPLSQSMTPHDT
jgi:class 3 adenylate cyclase